MGVPVNLLYSASMGPGIGLAFCYLVYTMGRSLINPALGPPMTPDERAEAYQQMTTERVGVPILVLGFLSTFVLTALILYAILGIFVDAWAIRAAGGLLVAAYAGYAYITHRYFRAIMLGISPLAALIGFTLGTILGGLATPTEASSCGAFGAMVLALLYNRLDWTAFKNACVGTMNTSAMVLFLAVASNVFGAVFTKLGTATVITNSLIALPLDDGWKLALILVLIFVLGWPFEWPAIILVFLPIFMPVIERLKFAGMSKLELLVWFGALVAVNLQTAFLSPPVAMSAYYLRNVVPQWPLATIYRGMADYMVIQCVFLLLLFFFPELSLWLMRALR
jgi:TRAP-type mannitol/chloroaromatic compound transport system permease large subunit